MPDTPLHNEVLLLRDVAAGDELAFQRLFNHYRKHIYTIAFKISHSSDTAEEILQDIFLKIWLNRGSLTEIQNFSAYLYTITKHEAFHALKRITRSQNVLKDFLQQEQLSDNSTENKVLERDYNKLLQQALSRLPQQQKLVYQLIKEQGLTRSETSAQLNIHPETVKSHLAQAMKNIRAYCLTKLAIIIVIATFLTFFIRTHPTRKEVHSMVEQAMF